MNKRIRVMIVDDHPMVRRGLATFLKSAPDIELVGEAGSGVEAIRISRQTSPDMELMDLQMPEMDGITATKAIRDADPEIQVIVVTSSPDDQLVAEAGER
jgi:DNA-binding NarL/FixJ family response regulator